MEEDMQKKKYTSRTVKVKKKTKKKKGIASGVIVSKKAIKLLQEGMKAMEKANKCFLKSWNEELRFAKKISAK